VSSQNGFQAMCDSAGVVAVVALRLGEFDSQISLLFLAILKHADGPNETPKIVYQTNPSFCALFASLLATMTESNQVLERPFRTSDLPLWSDSSLK
jgi:hypothetical protein